MPVGGRIRALRTARGLTLAQLSQASGVSKPYLSQLENGRASNPSVGMLVGLADALSVSLDELAGVKRWTPVQGASYQLEDNHDEGLRGLLVDGAPLDGEEMAIARDAIAEAVRYRRARRGKPLRGKGS